MVEFMTILLGTYYLQGFGHVGCDAAFLGKWIPNTQPQIPEERNHLLRHSKTLKTLKSYICHRY
jgi:hypothetical protein